MFSGLPCETHIAHIARIARTRGTVRVRRVGAPYAPHFAWFLHGFCNMWNSLLFCTVLHAVFYMA